LPHSIIISKKRFGALYLAGHFSFNKYTKKIFFSFLALAAGLFYKFSVCLKNNGFAQLKGSPNTPSPGSDALE